MESLAGSKISEELLKTLWYKRLLQQVQAILSVSKDTLTNLVEMADKISIYPTDILIINKQDQSQATYCSCENNSRWSSFEASTESLTQQIHKLHT
ncbi:hypothetical protein TNIN_126431 [Trichonephila inaurata madagascariensis]|uniref:Uncharacterized protein n=1 Tax=Trichonephila inaurata madagascariensis TaxID=2747483 RepID=A0A8X6WYR6_9ARAC|nr:hypothetical protein TNIN_126431 [Trichonephila inaurata madagascariensis]